MLLPDGIDELCTVVTEHRSEADVRARLAPEVLRACADAGLWVLCAPEEVGGLELSIADQMTIYEKLGAADPTVGWHAANTAATGVAVAWMPEADRNEIFANHDAPFGLGFTPADAIATPCDGGYLVKGSWPFMTGSPDARYCTVAVQVLGANGEPPEVPVVRRAVLPMSEMTVEGNWSEASAMRGTGSNAVRTDGVVVPESRVVDTTGSTPLLDRTLYRFPLSSALWGCAAVMAIGTLRGALRDAVLLGGEKISRVGAGAHYDDARVQQTIADAQAFSDAWSLSLKTMAANLWSVYEQGAVPDPALRARWWATVFSTYDLARQHVSQLYAVSTSAAYATQSRVGRALNDLHAFSVAFESFQSLRREAGRVLLGHEANHPQF